MHEKSASVREAVASIGSATAVNADGTLRLWSPETSRTRLAQIRGAYLGETVFVVACGPSLAEVATQELWSLLEEKVVISIKQSIDLMPYSPDFHIFNEVRMGNYSYKTPPPLRLSVSKFQPEHPSEIHFPIASYSYEKALFVTQDFDNWTLKRSSVRPWGVGVMFELGLHLPLFLGAKAAVFIGFDMNRRGPYHFFDKSPDNDADFYQVDREEFDYARSATKAFSRWSQRRGMDCFLYSPLSELDMPHLTLKELESISKN